MKTPLSKTNTAEQGAAAIELAMLAPILVILAAMAIDFGTYLLTSMKADSAATAAARYVMNHALDENVETSVATYLDETFPDAGFASGTSTCVITTGALEQTGFSYVLYQEGNAQNINATSSQQPFSVMVTMSEEWPAIASFFEEDGGTFTVRAVKCGDRDRTDGSSWN